MLYFIDDIIKLTQKKQTPRGKGAVTIAGGARKTKQQMVQKQVIRQQQQQRRSKLSVPKVKDCLMFLATKVFSGSVHVLFRLIPTTIFREG